MRVEGCAEAEGGGRSGNLPLTLTSTWKSQEGCVAASLKNNKEGIPRGFHFHKRAVGIIVVGSFIEHRLLFCRL
jgi:hypothetical protein